MYLDPNFGSMIIQLIIGVIAAAGAYLMIARQQVMAVLFKKKLNQDKIAKNSCEVKHD